MPESRPNQLARAFAVLALLAAFVLVVLVFANGNEDEDSSDGGGKRGKAEREGPSKRAERALDEGFWVVRSGDTLVKISNQTEIDLDELVELNPDLDPQALAEGERVSLRVESGSSESANGRDEDLEAGGPPESR